MTAEVHQAGNGVGDALFVAAAIRRARTPGVPQVIAAMPGLGLDVYRNLSFIDGLVHYTPDAFLPSAARGFAWCIPDTALRLEVADFRHRHFTRPMPPRYHVLQPATSVHKHHQWEGALPEEDGVLVLVGGPGDRGRSYPGAVDLRGQITIQEAMWVVAHAETVHGVESWVPVLGGLLHKPTTMRVRPESQACVAAWCRALPAVQFR